MECIIFLTCLTDAFIVWESQPSDRGEQTMKNFIKDRQELIVAIAIILGFIVCAIVAGLAAHPFIVR
jgi:hypothetical protein